MTIGTQINIIVYTRTTNGKIKIKNIPVLLKVKDSNTSNYNIGISALELEDYLNKINEIADAYEEITICIDSDNSAKVISFTPNKEDKKRCLDKIDAQ